TFQTFINDTLREFIDVSCVVYLDDILIYSKDPKEHKKHVRAIMKRLLEAGLYARPEKCKFSVERATFLGFIVSKDGIEMDPAKVQAVREWESPTCVKDVQCFLGFANFYRRFIKDYSRICRPLFDLLKKDSEFSWTPEHQQVFDNLKEAFCSAPILRHFDPELTTVLETDASDTVASGILSQQFPTSDGKSVLHPIAYFSKKLNPAQCNYPIGDKELLAIVLCFEEWHLYLHATEKPVLVFTDHANLQTFMTRAILNRRQARWGIILSEYNFQILYRPGARNAKADALTRRSGHLPKEGDGRLRTFDSVLSPENFKLSESVDPFQFQLNEISEPLISLIKTALKRDDLAKSVIKALHNGDRRHPKVDLSECSYENDLLQVYGLCYVPADEDLQCKILRSCHEHPAAGHPGRAATYEIVTRDYWWPSMRQTIARFIRNCDTCSRIKPVRHAPYGYLKPLSVPQRRWDSVSMDFIVGLPESNSAKYTSILVVVDRLSKMAHFIPDPTKVKAKDVARLFLNNVFRLHGFPSYIVSDRGSNIVGKFSKALCKLVGIQQQSSTAFHPQTDGQ